MNSIVPNKKELKSKTQQPDLKQPPTPEQVASEPKQQQQELDRVEAPLTVNPGDRIDHSKNLEEKAKQIAVDAPDITGEHIVVPTYFVFDMPDGTQKALHHVKDAEEISDMIRLARTDEQGNRIWW